MNNFSLTALLTASCGLALYWQAQQLSAAKHARDDAHREVTTQASRLRELKQQVSEKRQQTKSLEADLKGMAQSAALVARSTNERIAAPSAEDMAWDNGKDWIWFEKKQMLSLNLDSFREKHRSAMDNPGFHLSPAAEKLLAEYRKQAYLRKTKPTPEEISAEQRDPVGQFRSWATERPSEVVDQVAGFIQALATDREIEATTTPGYENDPTIALLLNLTPPEETEIQNVINEFIEGVRTLDRQHLQILPANKPFAPPAPRTNEHAHAQAVPSSTGSESEPLYANQIHLRIAPYNEAAQSLKEKTSDRIQSILGSERAEYWLTMADSNIAYLSHDLGRKARELIFSFDGQKYRGEQKAGDSSEDISGEARTPWLDIWWRPFIRKTAQGFEISQ